MIDPRDLETTARIFLESIQGLDLRFHFTGGLVVAYYGEPRMTQDIDVVINLTASNPDSTEFVNRLASRIHVPRELADRAIKIQDMFQAMDFERYLKIDFHIGEAVPGELGRSVDGKIFAGPPVPIVSKEDSILSKLLWAKKGSDKSRRDVVSMMRGPHELRWQSLEARAAELEVMDLLEELRLLAAM